MKNPWRVLLGLVFSTILLSTLWLGLASQRSAVRAATSPSLWTAGIPGEAFLYRVDRTTGAFIFTYTLPTLNSGNGDIAVLPRTGRQEIWFTEPAADRLGLLVYTTTTEYTFREYTVTLGSRPLNLVADASYIWYTAPGRNAIGRLNPLNGQTDEFVVPTPQSYPASLALAPDGSLWFTEMQADKIARLVVTTTTDYAFQEYYTATLSGGRPYGLAMVAPSVWVAETAHNRVIQFTPPNSWVFITSFGYNIDEPYELTAKGGDNIWGTERRGNRITRFYVGTLPGANPNDVAPAQSMPTALTLDPQNYVWFTQSGAGQIGKLIPMSSTTYYPLPLSGLIPTSIATDDSTGIWVFAYRAHAIYLPLVLRNYQ